MALLHLLGDAVGATNHLYRTFQYRDISFSVLQSEVNVIGKWQNGQRNQVEVFKTDRQAFIDALLNNITSRFPNV